MNPSAETNSYADWAPGDAKYTIDTSPWYGTYEFYFSGLSVQRDCTQDVSLTASSTTIFMGAIKAELVDAHAADSFIVSATSGGATKYLVYEVRTAVSADADPYYYFLIGSTTNRWYYIQRNITADCLYKGLTAPTTVTRVSMQHGPTDGVGLVYKGYWDSVYLGNDVVMTAGSSAVSNGDFEYPVLSSGAPYGWYRAWTAGAYCTATPLVKKSISRLEDHQS